MTKKNILILLLVVLAIATVYANVLMFSGNEEAAGGLEPEVPAWMHMGAQLMMVNGLALMIGCILGTMLQKLNAKK
jgi:flagellar basal body-associated protein FliL